MNRIAIFADVQNIYYTTRQAYQRQFDYRALWRRVAAGGEIVQAIAYAIQRHDEQQKKFQNALRHIGFDVLETADTVETIVLLSGDGDFDLLLQKVRQDYGVNAEVYGVPMLTANALVNAATKYHPINESLLL
jgi:uncharacterized LabA/DUF88 family protein